MSRHNVRKLRNCAGFTLIELLLYFALAAVMIGIIGGIGVNVIEGRERSHALSEVRYNAQFVFETLMMTIEKATSVQTPTTGATSSALSLSMEDGADTPTVFDLESGRLRMTAGTGVPQYISTESVEIDELTFTHIDPDTVRIDLVVSADNPEDRELLNIDEAFHGAMHIRNAD